MLWWSTGVTLTLNKVVSCWWWCSNAHYYNFLLIDGFSTEWLANFVLRTKKTCVANIDWNTKPAHAWMIDSQRVCTLRCRCQMFCPPHHLAQVQYMEWLSAKFPPIKSSSKQVDIKYFDSQFIDGQWWRENPSTGILWAKATLLSVVSLSLLCLYSSLLRQSLSSSFIFRAVERTWGAQGKNMCSDCFNRVLDSSIRVYRFFGAPKQSEAQGKMPQFPPSPPLGGPVHFNNVNKEPQIYIMYWCVKAWLGNLPTCHVVSHGQTAIT